ncbi:helix-turn-helix family protein [Escherichia coli P0299917.4]|nr:helix-turn-helix family protein [Escherichia coli P0299917.10]ENC54061.1 helix-turn-helix family protein [Escherichia coli P0299917.4]ENC66675.1 helix-turn-helix family protein [Escherichia coli P0299917.7]
MTKVKSVPFSQVKQKLLNTPEAVKGYEDADKELEMVEMLYEMREKAGLTKSALAERMGLRPSAISRLESNPYQTDIPCVFLQPVHIQPRYGTPVYHPAATQHAFERVTTQELFHHLCIAHIRHRFWHTLCAGITVLSLNL